MPFSAPPGTDPERHTQRLPRRIHRLRTLGMGLAALPTGMVLLENQAGAGHWVFLFFTTVLWPQLALWLALRHPEPFRGEIRNLLVDSILAGMWVPLMAFNLLPSVMLVTLMTGPTKSHRVADGFTRIGAAPPISPARNGHDNTEPLVASDTTTGARNDPPACAYQP